MARPISDEELQLKKRARRRLVGAIVLVSAVAVILPMVLDSEPKSASQDVDIQIPAPDSDAFKPKAVSPAASVAEGAFPKPSPGAAPGPDLAPSAPKPDTTASISKPTFPGGAPGPDSPAPGSPPATAGSDSPVPVIVSEEPVKPEVAEAKSGAPDSTKDAPRTPTKDHIKTPTKDVTNAVNGSYVVQVAALADASRVRQLQKQMARAGVKTYTEVVSTKSGAVTRVRAGPYPTRDAAEKVRIQLKKAGLDGKVVPK